MKIKDAIAIILITTFFYFMANKFDTTMIYIYLLVSILYECRGER